MKKLLLFICLLATTMLAKGVDFEYDGVTYTILSETDKTVSTKAGTFTNPGHSDLTDELNLHEEVPYNGETYTLTVIGDYSFFECYKLPGSLTIPESVTYIGEAAFYDCVSFTGSLIIPDSVTYIGNYAFSYCDGFTGSLTIGNSVTEIGTYAFVQCSGFTGSLTIGNSVTSIGDYAFYFCSGFTGSMTIPDSVTSIGNDAFCYCSGFTGSLTIPDSVIYIGNNAFRDCDGFTGSLTIGNSVTKIGTYAFNGCDGFTGSLTIGNSVTEIGNRAFYFCRGFTGSLTIPNSVTSIGENAFYRCTGFTGSLTIGNSVTSIGNNAFYLCFGFTAIELGESVEKIGYDEGNVFNGCINVESVTCHAVNPPLFYGSDNFTSDVLQNATLYVPTESMDLYTEADVWKDFVNCKTIENPDGSVGTTIADSAADVQVLVDGHYVTVIGLPEGENVGVFDLSGNMILESASPTFTIDAIGVFILRTDSHVFKIIIR